MPSLWADTLDEHRALVLGRLLDAYEDLRTEVGVEGVTLAAVAQRAGLARSAVYNYVSDKHELILASADRILHGAAERMRGAVDAAEGGPPGMLRAYIHHTLAMHASETGAGDDLMPMLSPEEQARFTAMLAPLRAMLVEVVTAGVASGDFAGDPEDLVGLVWAVLAGYRMPVAAGQLDPAATAALAADVLIAGFAPPP